jgi:hypothetical protein
VELLPELPQLAMFFVPLRATRKSGSVSTRIDPNLDQNPIELNSEIGIAARSVAQCRRVHESGQKVHDTARDAGFLAAPVHAAESKQTAQSRASGHR